MEVPEIFRQLVCLAGAVEMFLFVGLPIIRSLLTRSPGDGLRNTGDDAAQELCKACQYDARGLLRCPECGSETRAGRRERLAKLLNAWPAQGINLRSPAPNEFPVVILTTDDGWAAPILRGHLEARGIKAEAAESSQLYGAVYQSATISYRLTVWSADEERARAILEHLWPAELRGQ